MNERKGLVSFKELPVTLVGDEIKVGQTAPEFTVLKQDLSELKLSDLDGKIKVLSIAPSLDTRVCELQAIRFNNETTQVSDDVEIVSITVDLPYAQRRFCEALDIKGHQVVSDHRDLDFGYKYGLVMKELRLLARAVIVLDKDNVVRYIDINRQVAQEPNYEAALDAVKSLV